jgi:creatinine amidohydrolase/Fe(II)-dependent formamide hydrolase-like protein
MSIDITAPLLTRYVTGYANAIAGWLQPSATYVVDVHGSIVHRRAIQDGLAASQIGRWSFRWLHDPLVALSGDRGDQHAGGVETALIEFINPALVDSNWWPQRRDELLRRQMSLEDAVALSGDLPAFIERVESEGLNGIVGGLENYDAVEGRDLMERILEVSRTDLDILFSAR